MPPKQKSVIDIREATVKLVLQGFNITEVSARTGFSRATVSRWLERYRASGRAGLEDHSRAPAHCPHRTAGQIEALIVAEREKWKFGSKKIRQRLIDAYPEVTFPSRATFDAIFQRHGLQGMRRRRQRPKGQTPFARRYEATEPGQLLTIDHKGQFRLGNGQYCYPLTMLDHVSRFLLACHGLTSTALEAAWPIMEKVFRERGLPLACLSDNGPPFGATGRGRISTLSVKLMKLDVQPIFIYPGHPEQNGAHERMHRTLKDAVTRPPGYDLRGQQRMFDAFRHEYNVERPHEALGMRRPAQVYKPLRFRPYPRKIKSFEYDAGFEVRRVSSTGTIKWNGQTIYVGEAFREEFIALEPLPGRVQNLHFYGFTIGKLDEQTNNVN